MACVVKSRPEALSSYREVFSKNLEAGTGVKTYGMGGEEGDRRDENRSPDSCCELEYGQRV